MTLIHKHLAYAGTLKPCEVMAAYEQGFIALCEGPDGLAAALRVAQDGPSGGGMGFMHDFKHFYRYLTRMETSEGADKLRGTVRRYIISNYPTGIGESVLTEPTKERVLHSPLSASIFANVSRSRLCSALQTIRETGAFPDLPRPTRQLWVPCKEWDPWLKTYGETIIFKQAAPRIGASPATLLKVVSAGWLKPFVDFHKQVPRFHPADLSRFVNQMLKDAEPIDALDDTIVSVDRAPLVFTARLIDLLALVWEGKLTETRTLRGRFGLASIVFNFEEASDFFKARELPKNDSWPIEDARRHLRISSTTMTLLRRQGLIGVVKIPHHRTRRRASFITRDVMRDFLAKYETLGRLAHFEHVQAKSVQTRLSRLKIDPLPFPGTHSKIYRREDLTPYIG